MNTSLQSPTRAQLQRASGVPTGSLLFSDDHPDWNPAPGYHYRLASGGKGSKWLALWDHREKKFDLRFVPRPGGKEEDPADFDLPEITSTDLSDVLGDAPIPLVRSLASLGTLVRLSTLSLWEALPAAVIAQNVTAGRDSYRRWCRLNGAYWVLSAGPLYTVPGAQTVLTLPDCAFTDAGIDPGTARALRATAAAYLEKAEDWSRYTGEQLVDALQRIRGVTRWTAIAAAVEYKSDGASYPLVSLLDTWASQVSESSRERARHLCNEIEMWAADSPERQRALTLAIAARIHRAAAGPHRSSFSCQPTCGPYPAPPGRPQEAG